MPGKKKLDYDPSAFQELLKQLFEKTGESYSEAARASELHQTTISNYMRGTRPMRDACIALADHFGMNPNEMLEAAGYEPFDLFDRLLADPNALPHDINKLVIELMKINDEEVREEMVEALRRVLQVQMQMREEALRKAKEASALSAGKPVAQVSG